MTVSSKRKAASKKYRSGLKVKRQRLVFPNPYRTTAFLNPSGPPLTTKLDLATGVQSVEQAEKQRDMQYMIQRYNAGILNHRERAMKALAEEEKARKTSDLIQKYLKSKGLSKEQIDQKYNLRELSKKLTQAQDREDDIPLHFENELGEFKKQLEQKTARYLDSDPSRAAINIHSGDIYPTYFRDLEHMRLQQMIQNERDGSRIEHAIPRLFQGSQSYTNPQDSRMFVNPYSDRYANFQQREVDSQLEKVDPVRQGLVEAEPLKPPAPSAAQIETGEAEKKEIRKQQKPGETPLPPLPSVPTEMQDVPAEKFVEDPEPAATAAAAPEVRVQLGQNLAKEKQAYYDLVVRWYKENDPSFKMTNTELKKECQRLAGELSDQVTIQVRAYHFAKTGSIEVPPNLTRNVKHILDEAKKSAYEIIRSIRNQGREEGKEKAIEEEAQKDADGNSGHGIKPLYQRVKNTVSYGGGADDISSIIDLKNARRERKDKRRKLFRIIHQLEHAGETPSNEKVKEAFPDTADTLDVSQFTRPNIPTRKIFKNSFLKQKGYHF